jgi:hypothetical protein
VSKDIRNVGGTLVRRKLSFEANFTQIPNSYVRDKRLSMKARGILGYLMSQANGQEVSLRSLADDSEPDGLASIRSGVEELERHGYLVRENARGKAGTYGTRWELTEPRKPLFDLVDNTAFENRTRNVTAFENRTNTAFENRTNKEHNLRTLSKTSQTSHSSERSIAADCPATPSGYGHHIRGEFGHCIYCHQRWDRIA